MNVEMDKKMSIEYAGFVIRLAAMFIDVFIVLISLFIIDSGINLTGVNLSFLDFDLPILNVRISWLYLVLPVAYWTFFESSALQATIGKRLAGIMVIDENGKRLSVTKAFIRAILRNITLSLCVYLIGLLGIVTMDFNKRKQTLYDIIAKTCVIRGKPTNYRKAH